MMLQEVQLQIRPKYGSNTPSKARPSPDRFLPLCLSVLIVRTLGTSLTVYGILINIVRTEYLFTANTDLTLNLDGDTSTYTHSPANTESYQYKVPVFSKQGLSDTTHTARVTLNPSSAFL